MTIPTKSELRYLLESRQGPCITMMFSTNRTSIEREAEELKLRNGLREVEQRLRQHDLRGAAIENLLEPVRAQVEQEAFWQHPGDGLVVFLAPGIFRSYQLPFAVKDRIVVTDHFFLKPLLPLLVDDGRFYVLALSQNKVRLLEGTRFSIEEIALPKEVPHSLADALKYEDIDENDVRHHSSSSGAVMGKAGRRAAIFHGQGVGIDTHKDEILRYFQQINRGLHELLREESAPLVLAGVGNLLSIYREANTYPHLVSQGIAGNPDRSKPDTLRELAWVIVEPTFLEQEREAAARYKDTVGTWLASSSIEEVLPAAYYGRIESVFIALDQEQWGHYDAATNTLVLHEQEEAGDDDLLDIVGQQGLRHGGKVYAVEQRDMPGATPVAAIFRY
jgi:hypothetical protein